MKKTFLSFSTAFQNESPSEINTYPNKKNSKNLDNAYQSPISDRVISWSENNKLTKMKGRRITTNKRCGRSFKLLLSICIQRSDPSLRKISMGVVTKVNRNDSPFYLKKCF